MKSKFIINILLAFLISTSVLVAKKPTAIAYSAPPSEIRIFGLVNNPINITYANLLSFPMISEVATFECVDQSWQVTLGWTGVPLFYLLTLAQVKAEAYDVIFRATDDYSSSLTIEDALKPTTILALRANGTLLSEIASREGGFKIAAPGKWGYKWVSNVQEIEVVDYDYKGTWEQVGWPDEASMPDYSPPPIVPPLQNFNLVFGNRTFGIQAFTNASITGFNFDYLRKEIDLNVTVPSEAHGFIDLIIPQTLLAGPYSTLLNGEQINPTLTSVIDLTYLYLPLQEGSLNLRATGTEFFGNIPNILVEYNQTTVAGEPVTFDAGKSADDGAIINYVWDFGDGTKANGSLVSHSYVKEGTYTVALNVTDNDGLSSIRTLTVTVEKTSAITLGFVNLIIAAASTAIVVILILILLILRLDRKTRATREQKPEVAE